MRGKGKKEKEKRKEKEKFDFSTYTFCISGDSCSTSGERQTIRSSYTHRDNYMCG
jgi:hypothetical protein